MIDIFTVEQLPGAGLQTWSPISEISTLIPQLEHLMVGNRAPSINPAMSTDKRSTGYTYH